MKGKLNTDNLLRAVLNKEHGILPPGTVLSHITVAEVPNRDKLLIYSDVAVIPEPTLAQREAMMGYLVKLSHTPGHQDSTCSSDTLHRKGKPQVPRFNRLRSPQRNGSPRPLGRRDSGRPHGHTHSPRTRSRTNQRHNLAHRRTSRLPDDARHTGRKRILQNHITLWRRYKCRDARRNNGSGEYCPREATPPRASWPAWPWLAWPQCTDLNTHSHKYSPRPTIFEPYYIFP